jgi:hypothetical protein
MKSKREPINPNNPEWQRRLSELCAYAGVDITNSTSVTIKSSMNSYVEIDVEYLATSETNDNA